VPAPKRAAAKNPAKKPAAAGSRHNWFAKIVGFRDKRAPSSAGIGHKPTFCAGLA
jgi:hypothetical protein